MWSARRLSTPKNSRLSFFLAIAGIFVNVCENEGILSGAKPRAGAEGGQENAAPGVPPSKPVAALLLTALVAVFCGGCKGGEQPAAAGVSGAAVAAGAGSSRAADSDEEEGGKPGPAAAEFRRLFLSPASSDSVRQLLARHLVSRDPDFLVREYGNPANTAPIRAAINRGVAAGDTAVIPLLVLLFRQRGGEERIDFEVALLRFGRRAEKPFAALLGDADPSVVLRALDALAKLEASAQIEAVAQQLHHRDSWVRIGAAHALGEIGDTTAVAFLLEALDDSSYSVANAAMVGLGRLRASRAFNRLIEFTSSGNPHVRKHAAMALGELGDPRAGPVLRKLAARDGDSGVRFMAGRAIKVLEGDQE